jgi:GntR family transcriptional regulator, transcriptional repressor for pyruvate dehydrogenase complex
MTVEGTVGQLSRVDVSGRDSVSMEVARQLLEYLLAGETKPGMRLPPERKLAEALGVGRTVVREALKSLTLLGLIEVRQGDGNYVRATESTLLPQAIEWGLLLGAKRTRDLVEARRIIEVSLAGLAAERRDDRALADLHARIEEMAAARDPDDFVAADVAFHLRIAEAAGNETLLGVMTSMWTLLQVWISRVMHAATDFAPSLTEHRLVLEAIEADDPQAASSAMEAHLANATRRLEATLPRELEGDGSKRADLPALR